MRAYKVLFSHVDGRLGSFFAPGDADTTYIPGEVTVAPQYLANAGYHLCCFDSLEVARKWDDQRWNCVWEVEAEGILYELPPMLAFIDYAKCFTPVPDHSCSWPTGTIMAERVTLIREIEREEEDEQVSAVCM